GVWNQIFLALITYAIAMCIQLKSGTKLSLWDVLQSLRACWDKAWFVLEAELHPKPSRFSKGREKVPKAQKQVPRLRTTVGMMKPRKSKN
ncbi:IS4/IS5 family transposase, partial [Paenibacillus chartarius]